MSIPCDTRELSFVRVSASLGLLEGGRAETYASKVALATEAVEIAATEDKGAEILLDRLVQAIGRGQRQ